MDFIDQLQRIEYVCFLINSKSACSAEELAAKLNISKRQVTNNLKLIRELGVPLKYDRRTKRFYFEDNKIFTHKIQ